MNPPYNKKLIQTFIAAPSVMYDIARNNDWGRLSPILLNLGLRTFVLSSGRRKAYSEEMGYEVPTRLSMDLGYACNLKCKNCYARSLEGVIDPQLRENVEKDMLELGIHTLVVFGGEPFHPSTRDQLFTGASDNPNIEYIVCTNGTYLSQPEVISQVKERKNILPVVSLDGLAELNDLLRGKGTFRKICSALESLQEERIFYGISTVVTKENVKEVCSEEFFRFLSLYNPGAIYFRKVVGEGAPSSEEFEDFLFYLKAGVAKRHGLHVISGELRNPEKPECGERQYNCVHIEASGRVKKGRFGPEIGNLKEQSLMEVLHSEKCKSAFTIPS